VSDCSVTVEHILTILNAMSHIGIDLWTFYESYNLR